MSFQDKDRQMVGEIERGELYREIELVNQLLQMVANNTSNEPDGGLGGTIEVAQRMVDSLAMKVSP